jgi:hypothetical protein
MQAFLGPACPGQVGQDLAGGAGLLVPGIGRASPPMVVSRVVAPLHVQGLAARKWPRFACAVGLGEGGGDPVDIQGAAGTRDLEAVQMTPVLSPGRAWRHTSGQADRTGPSSPRRSGRRNGRAED